jgi:hypothetical protein
MTTLIEDLSSLDYTASNATENGLKIMKQQMVVGQFDARI